MKTAKTTVYFDGACPLCSREIAHYRKKDTEGRLHYVDISRSDFDARREGLDPDKVKKHMHVRLADGELAVGVDAFIAIWNELPGYGPLAKLAGLPGINLLLRGGYRLFAEVRPYLPKRHPPDCKHGSCPV